MARRWSGVVVLGGLLASARVAFADLKAPDSDEVVGTLIRLGAVLLVVIVAAIAILVVVVKAAVRSRKARSARANHAPPTEPSATLLDRAARENFESATERA